MTDLRPVWSIKNSKQIFEAILPKNAYILRVLDEWFERAYLCPLITSGWTGAFVGWIWLGRGHNLRSDFYSFIKGQGCEHF